MELVVMALILAAVLAAQYFVYNRWGLKDLSYKLTIAQTEAFEDEEIEIVEEIENAKALPLAWIRTEINCSRWLSFYGQQAQHDAQRGFVSSIFVLKGYQKCRRVWRVRCEKRGIFSIQDVTLSVSDLFGLARPTRMIKLSQTVRVLPSPANMEAEPMSAQAYIGDTPVKRFVLADPFMISGAKEYTGREPMNRIHWQQTARTGSLMVYNNEYTTERNVLVILNLQRNYHSDTQRLTVSTMETQIKGAAYMLDRCYKTHTAVTLAANCSEPFISETGEGYEHTITLLRRLAEMKNSCGCHIDDYVSGLDMALYTDIVFVSSFVSEGLCEYFSRLNESGKSVIVFSTDIEELDVCQVWHIPRSKYYPPESGDE